MNDKLTKISADCLANCKSCKNYNNGECLFAKDCGVHSERHYVAKALRAGIDCHLGYACDACPHMKACDEGDIATIQKSEAQKQLKRSIENFCKIFNAEISIKITLKDIPNDPKKSKS